MSKIRYFTDDKRFFNNIFRYTIDTNQFISTWNTENISYGSTNINQIMLPLVSTGTYDFIVEWGDGNSDRITTFNQPEIVHTYLASGIYTIKISGICHGWSFHYTDDILKLINISQWGENFRLGNEGEYFYGCENLTITAVDILDLTGTTTFRSLFESCYSLTDVPNIDKWDTSNITNMQYAFGACLIFNQSLNDWNTSQVTTMNAMFYSCYEFNQSLNDWDTSQVTTMNAMFYSCYKFNQPLNNWDTSQVTDMFGMFYLCYEFNQPLNNWNTSQVTDMTIMFQECYNFNQSVSNFNTSNVTSMYGMFWTCKNFNQSVSNFNTSNVTSMYGMFGKCKNFNQSVSNFNTSNVTDMAGMFYSCSIFNQSVSNFDTSKVTNMSYMFANCYNFKQNVNTFNITSLTDANNMFALININDIGTTTRYDALLNSWGSQLFKNNVVFSAGTSKYSTDATAARTTLINAGWVITDGGM